LTNLINSNATSSVNDADGNKLFDIEVKLNPAIIFFAFIILISLCLIIFLITFSISKLMIRMTSKMIIKPLIDLDLKLAEVSKGNLTAASSTQIILKKPAVEVENLVNSTNIIMSKMHEYSNQLANQNTELEAQNITLLENSQALENVNKNLDNKNIKLKNIFDNVEEGFLSFNKSLLIHQEYSLECEKIFKKSIGDEKLSSLLYPDNKASQQFIDELLDKIFETKGSQRRLFLSLLPEEITILDKVISLSYKVVRDEENIDTIMAILVDITDKRKLERQMDEERKSLKMVVKAIINGDEFKAIVREFQDFASMDFKDIKESDYEKILRQIHTFKGNFSQYEMINTIKELDSLENKLYENKDIELVRGLDDNSLLPGLRMDLSVIENYAGKDFIGDGEICYIKKEKLIEIEEKIQSLLSSKESKEILPLIRSLRYKSIKELLMIYPDYIYKLGERINKTVAPMVIEGDDIMLDTDQYQEVIKSLVHIFRNALDHGIESEDLRLEKGKDQLGNIRCTVEDLSDSIMITIEDDGRGIDIEALGKSAVEKGIVSDKELEAMDEEEKYQLVFEMGVTSKEKANYLSGRGVGLAAVKEAVKNIGGNIHAYSQPGYGTTFKLTLPKLLGEIETKICPRDFAEKLIEASKKVIKDFTNINLSSEKLETKNMIALNKVTALISLNGTFNSIIMLSANEIMAKKLVHGFIIDEVKEEEVISYIEDVIGELSNTILGNTFGYFDDTATVFRIGIPAMISNSDSYIKYTQAEILACNLTYKEYEFSINMLQIEEDFNTVLEEEI
jgi:two-component system, chemotaxis family, sensor kinase CheA